MVEKGFVPAEPIGRVLRAAFQKITAAAERGENITGISTGYEMLDEKTAGLHNGDLMIIAARPGMGKTSLALNIALNVASPRTITWSSPGKQNHNLERQEPGSGVYCSR